MQLHMCGDYCMGLGKLQTEMREESVSENRIHWAKLWACGSFRLQDRRLLFTKWDISWWLKCQYVTNMGFPDGAVIKNLPATARNSRDVGSIPVLGRSPGGGNVNPFQYSWEIPWREEPGRLYSPWGCKESNTTECTHTHTHTHTHITNVLQL